MVMDNYETAEVIDNRRIKAKENIHAYPILVETHGQVVTQSEHTIPKFDRVDIITL